MKLYDFKQCLRLIYIVLIAVSANSKKLRGVQIYTSSAIYNFYLIHNE